MKGRWHHKTIGEIALVKGGKRVPKGYKLVSEPTPYPYITVSDFTEDDPGNIIITVQFIP